MEPSVVLPLSADLPRALSPCLLPHLLCRLSQGPQYRGEAGLSHLRVSSEDLSQLISRMWQFSQYYLIIISIIEHSDSHRKKLIWDNFLPPLRLFVGVFGAQVSAKLCIFSSPLTAHYNNFSNLQESDFPTRWTRQPTHRLTATLSG